MCIYAYLFSSTKLEGSFKFLQPEKYNIACSLLTLFICYEEGKTWLVYFYNLFIKQTSIIMIDK